MSVKKVKCPYCGYEQSFGSRDREVCEGCKKVIDLNNLEKDQD